MVGVVQGMAEATQNAVQEVELRIPLRYFDFDLLYLDGENCTPLSQPERSRRLREELVGQFSCL